MPYRFLWPRVVLPAHFHKPVVKLSFSVSKFLGLVVAAEILLALDVAVYDVEDSGALRGNLNVVGYEHYCGAFFVELDHLAHNFVGRCAVEGAGGLVGKDHLGIVNHAAADAGSLKLSAGYLVDVVVGGFLDAELFHEGTAALLGLASFFMIPI